MPIAADNRIRNQARADVRVLLSKLQGFREMPEKDQLQLYKDMINARTSELQLHQRGQSSASVARGMDFPGPGGGRASDKIDQEMLKNKRIDQVGELAGDFMQNVNFPKFVRDLLKGVFDANLEVTLKQMEAYINLMKAATASISKFINSIDDAASFGYLAENHNDEFGIDEEQDDDGNPTQILVDKDGNKVAGHGISKDEVDAGVKAKIMEAKIAMAKEQRALLRETILMGVSRLVVERGTVKAAVVFDIKAKEKIKTTQKAANKRAQSHSSGFTHSGGLLGSFLGGPSMGSSDSERSTEISVASAKGVSSTELAAKVTGSVEIIFKSDYFKLDNFATMYGPVAPQPAPGAATPPGGPAPALPAPPAAAQPRVP